MRSLLPLAGAFAAIALLAGCASAQSFSDVAGDLRVTGNITQNAMSQRAGLNVQLYDKSTGYPVDAQDVEVKAGRTSAVHAQRKQLGTYTADIPNRRRINLIITTKDSRSLLISLHQP